MSAGLRHRARRWLWRKDYLWATAPHTELQRMWMMARWRVDSEGVALCPSCAKQDADAQTWVESEGYGLTCENCGDREVAEELEVELAAKQPSGA